MTTTAPEVALAAPDIARWRESASGLDYVHSFAAAEPGPHVLVTALVHGNEICGAIALDRLLSSGLRPERGRLSLAFVNVAAYGRFDPAEPAASRFVDEDFNRLWTPARLDSRERSVELARARALRPLVEAADLLLDIHSLQQGADPLLLAGPLEKGRQLARRVGTPATIVADRGHAAGTRMRDFGAFGDPASEKTALLVECGPHWQAGTDQVALATLWHFLTRVGCLAAEGPAPWPLPPGPLPPQRVVEVSEAVTVETSAFRFSRPYRGLEVVPAAGTVIARDGKREVRTPYDDCVLVMPSLRLQPGQTAVRLGRLVA